ncbi:hypothetical protein OEW28_17240 [Defluviimonas sp. WL0002]|uniref:Uncharacterized protein n=1 Tax=Albidovulum marisflavi TaxID=2984159 RepID=A0ABT2ZGU4_9RHOB|nr:hypothetical protein [Defluviimonas sp. WL0002]MCV2870362.1 hypothetical protein [Defluviimonas sp. WL0002]
MLTPAEKQRRYRERQKAKRLDALKKPEIVSLKVFASPFCEWAQSDGNFSDFELYLALAGIEPPQFDDDRGPLAFALNEAVEGMEDPFPGAENSLARAEVMVGCLIDAAATLASIVNRYKEKEITRRVDEIEKSDKSDENERKAATREIVRLSKLQDQLKRQVRWTFPQWKVSGA